MRITEENWLTMVIEKLDFLRDMVDTKYEKREIERIINYLEKTN